MRVCSVESCEREYYSTGYCAGHYTRVRKHGDPQVDVPLRARKQAIRACVDCDRVRRIAGYDRCDGCYWYYRQSVADECDVEGCSKHAVSRGVCIAHYRRLMRNGDVDAEREVNVTYQGESLFKRVMARVTGGHPSGCWVWEGASNEKGYGGVNRGGDEGGTASVHRWAYEEFEGPVPEGYEVHHECYNPSCLNPQHLSAVTPEYNKWHAAQVRAGNITPIGADVG